MNEQADSRVQSIILPSVHIARSCFIPTDSFKPRHGHFFPPSDAHTWSVAGPSFGAEKSKMNEHSWHYFESVNSGQFWIREIILRTFSKEIWALSRDCLPRFVCWHFCLRSNSKYIHSLCARYIRIGTEANWVFLCKSLLPSSSARERSCCCRKLKISTYSLLPGCMETEASIEWKKSPKALSLHFHNNHHSHCLLALFFILGG